MCVFELLQGSSSLTILKKVSMDQPVCSYVLFIALYKQLRIMQSKAIITGQHYLLQLHLDS